MGGTSQIQKNIIAARILGLGASLDMYDMPDEIDVGADGALRIITLNRPDALNAVNDALHTGLARLWPRLSEDHDARAAVLTGSGRAFSAGGDFELPGGAQPRRGAAREDHRARPGPRARHGPLPGAGGRGRQRPGGRAWAAAWWR